MPVSSTRYARLTALTVAAILGCRLAGMSATLVRAEVSPARLTPIVRAVQAALPSTVNIHGDKIVSGEGAGLAPGDRRKVNGMGTGVVIDERGYIVTNHHVVDGVRKILVTTNDGRTHIGVLVSYDPKTDLAIIKIDAPEPLPVINIGTSSDLMNGESVIAVGNAYGYENTVTDGIISALHRSVQVSDTQSYEDLIQTDAAINPGNSGGPLMNIDGQMIGINVAVRAGAQNIGFAIPVDRVLAVATELISTRRLERTWHGVVLESGGASLDGALVKEVAENSPAAQIGLRPGDIIKSIAAKPVQRMLDIERALLGKQPGNPVPITIERDRRTESLDLTVAPLPDASRGQQFVAAAGGDNRFWEVLGLRLESVPQRQFQAYNTRYRGGMVVTDVREWGPAARQGIRRGDILVGMHKFETVTADNVEYVINHPEFGGADPVKFYILRGSETLYGHITVAARNTQ